MRYFKLTPDGDIAYLTDDDVAAAEKIKDTHVRNREFANVELQFHKQGEKHEQSEGATEPVATEESLPAHVSG